MRVVLTENVDVIISKSLYFNSFKLINVPTEEEIIQELYEYIYLYCVTATGYSYDLYGQEATDYLNAGNPHYDIKIYDREFDIYTTYTVNGKEIRASTWGYIYIVNESSEISPKYKYYYDSNLYLDSIDKEHIFEQIKEQINYFYITTPSNDYSLYLYSEDFNINYFEIVTDLSNIESGDVFEIECTYYGATVSFMAKYYAD